ncbi:MAG: EAL domain-containing protein [Pseudomonadota bacterium]
MKQPGFGLTSSPHGPAKTTAEIKVSQLEQMFEHWPHAVYALDCHGHYVFQNAVDRAAFGDLDEKGAEDVGDEAACEEDWSEAHNRVLAGETVTYTVSRGDGTGAARDAEVTMTPLKDGEDIIGILGMTIDRSDAGRLQRELETTAAMAQSTFARLERLTDNVPGGIFEFKIDAQGEMSFPYVNSSMGPLLGTTREALLEDAQFAFIHDHPDDAQMVKQSIERTFHTLEPVKITHRMIHPEYGLRWHRVEGTATRRPDGSVVWHGYIFDVTEEMARAEELEAARHQMEVRSLVDPLTQLPNRRACDQLLAERHADPQSRQENCTIIRIDLDHFKAVNDTLGHAAGDAVLCRVSDCLRETIAADDFAARLGGDEFVIILAPRKTQDDANDTIDRLRQLIDRPFMYEGRHCHFDASFGIASAQYQPEDPMELLSSADAALLQAKKLGRGRVATFTADLHNEIIHRRRRAKEIRAALDRDEFVPFFHPQIDAQSGEIAGFEVLARWRHPTEGYVAPGEFLNIAEQIHVVQDIDRIMFEKALTSLERLKEQGFSIPKLSFNVSAGRVHDPDIVRSVRALQTKGTQVAFELLESILLEEETALFAHHIDLIKECGVDIEVDDFGSGRASIIGVLKVSPDTLKIDQRLIEPLFESKTSRGLLSAIIDIGRSLNIDITAEGVETMAHARELREMGCKTLQGYAFARPMPESHVKHYLSSFQPVFHEPQSIKCA